MELQQTFGWRRREGLRTDYTPPGISEGNLRVIRHRALAEVRRCLQTGPG
jgi:hypothetical protein